MRAFFLICIATFIACATQGQDLIVLHNNDSINCKITRFGDNYIYFTFKHENEIQNTLLPQGKVKLYLKDFFDEPDLKVERRKAKVKGEHSPFRISLTGGWSYLIAPTSENVPRDFRLYIDELRTGYHLGADMGGFISENLGFGLKYRMFGTKNALDGIYIEDTLGNRRTGTLSDDIKVHYIGPSICTKLVSKNKKTHFLSDFSFGFVSYKNDARVVDKFTMSGRTAGMVWNLSLDHLLNDHLAIGFGLGLTLATLYRYEVEFPHSPPETIELDEDNLESLSRVDFSVGLKFYE